MKLRRSAMYLSGAALGLLTLVGAFPLQALADDDGAQATSTQHHQPGSTQKKRASELVKVVREATARFRDLDAAKAEDYELHFGCVSGPDVGAMGLHYVNMGLVMDGKLDATRPEIVIYEPQPDGRARLIGADYLVLADAWHAAHDAPPELMGQLFHYFESPNRFGLPAFYTLHVWAWKDNPSGAFVNWHPHVSCDGFEGQGR